MESAIISVEIIWRKPHFYLSTKEHKFHEIFVILITNEKFVWFSYKNFVNLHKGPGKLSESSWIFRQNCCKLTAVSVF